MKKKVKIALGILLFVTMVMLMVSSILMIQLTPGLMGDDMMDSSDNQAGAGLGVGIAMIFIVIILLVIAGIWLLNSLINLIFLPIVLTAKSETKLRKALLALLIITAIFLVSVVLGMIISWSFIATLSATLNAVYAITMVCYVGSFVAIIISYAKINKLCKQN